MLSESILDTLNPEQRRAVEFTEGPLLVLAGAGSGKTRVLTHRIAYLIGACGIPPDSILAVTFTNKAAAEMRERVEKLLGPQAGGVWVGTFHSTCVRILRREIGHLGRSRGFVIYDEADSLGVVKDALKRHSLDPKVTDPKRVRWRIDQWKNQGTHPAAAGERASDIDEERCAELYSTYQRLLLDANALDFGDLLLQTVSLFDQHPRVLETYQQRWQYLLIDEYQDTNRVQYQLVHQLSGAHDNLCVVGDPDQSIYAWRGADIRNILDFERDHDDVMVVKLERNYRSTQPILAGASAVVARNTGRRERGMFAEREQGDPIRLFEADDDREEARFVVSEILANRRSEGRRSSDFAVLYRTNAQSRLFEEELLRFDIPYTVVGGVRFYDRAEIRDVLAYLRVLSNPSDDQSLRRIVNRPTRGIGKTTLARAEALAVESATSLALGLRRLAESGAGRSAAKVRSFLTLLDELREELSEARPADAIAALLERTGILRNFEEEGTPEAMGRYENLRELVASAEDFDASEHDDEELGRSQLELYLDQVSLLSDLDSWDDCADRVSLMTAHSAKGLEFPIVFMVGMEEGIFPHASAERDSSGIEEERRLCYVGMTRAMDQLVMTCAGRRRLFRDVRFQSPSRFFDEIPAAFVRVEGGRPGIGEARLPRGEFDSSLDYSYSQDPVEPEAGVRPGDRVRHSVFGVGTVLAVQGTGLSQKLRIRFERVGVKTVMVRYADLELVPGES
ncbi:MAG: UvrD-helicase domain-containing protein [Myxococcota bacterium]